MCINITIMVKKQTAGTLTPTRYFDIQEVFKLINIGDK